MGLKFNPLIFSGLDVTGSGGGPSGPTSWKDPVVNAAALPVLGNSDGDARVTLDNGSIYVWSSTGSNWRLVQQFRVDKVTLTGTDITNKYVTLTNSPIIAASTCLDIIGGIQQDYGTDFTVSGSQLDWNGLGLDGVLSSGDKLIVYYF